MRHSLDQERRTFAPRDRHMHCFDERTSLFPRQCAASPRLEVAGVSAYRSPYDGSAKVFFCVGSRNTKSEKTLTSQSLSRRKSTRMLARAQRRARIRCEKSFTHSTRCCRKSKCPSSPSRPSHRSWSNGLRRWMMGRSSSRAVSSGPDATIAQKLRRHRR